LEGGSGENNTNLSSLKTMVKREKENKTTLCCRYSSTISAYNRIKTRSCINLNNTYELTDITIARNEISRHFTVIGHFSMHMYIYVPILIFK